MKKNERENAPGAEKEKKVGRDDMEKKASRVGEWSRKEGRCLIRVLNASDQCI